MDNKKILENLIFLAMQLQEEFLKEKQDFEKQRLLNCKYVAAKKEVLSRMDNTRQVDSYTHTEEIDALEAIESEQGMEM